MGGGRSGPAGAAGCRASAGRGCHFDRAVGGGAMAVRHLVAPARSAAGGGPARSARPPCRAQARGRWGSTLGGGHRSADGDRYPASDVGSGPPDRRCPDRQSDRRAALSCRRAGPAGPRPAGPAPAAAAAGRLSLPGSDRLCPVRAGHSSGGAGGPVDLRRSGSADRLVRAVRLRYQPVQAVVVLDRAARSGRDAVPPRCRWQAGPPGPAPLCRCAALVPDRHDDDLMVSGPDRGRLSRWGTLGQRRRDHPDSAGADPDRGGGCCRAGPGTGRCSACIDCGG